MNCAECEQPATVYHGGVPLCGICFYKRALGKSAPPGDASTHEVWKRLCAAVATLEDVVAFYDRGGNFAAFNQDNFDPNIVPLGLTNEERAALVALMKAMTDERVRFQKAPFDHPELTVPNP